MQQQQKMMNEQMKQQMEQSNDNPNVRLPYDMLIQVGDPNVNKMVIQMLNKMLIQMLNKMLIQMYYITLC